MRKVIICNIVLLFFLLINFNCKEKHDPKTSTLDKQSEKIKILEDSISNLIKKTNKDESNFTENVEDSTTIKKINKIDPFLCDNERLVNMVQQKVGIMTNIMTVNKNDELKTCDCESYAPTYDVYRPYKASNGSIQKELVTGAKVIYKAQLKTSGEIVWDGHVE